MPSAGEMQWEVAASPGALSAFSYDGTYIWMTARYTGTNSRLFRFSPTLKKFIKPDGSVGDYTNAYVDLGATASGVQASPVSNGTYFVIPGLTVVSPDSTKLYRCSDLGLVGGYAGLTNTIISNGGDPGFFFNGEWYYPGWNGGTSKGCLVALNSALGWRYAYDSTLGSSLRFARLAGGKVLLGAGGQHVERLTAATMTRDWVKDMGAGKFVNDAAYDPIRDEVWVSVADGECIRLRGSDGAILKRDATTGTYSEGLIASAVDSIIAQGCGVLVDGANVWAGGGGASGFRLTRRSTSPTGVVGQLSSYGAKSSGHWLYLPNHPFPQLVIDGTVYFAIGGPAGAYSWTTAAVGWIEDDGVAPDLTSVTPGAGSTIRLGFSGPVGMDGPTVGPPAGGASIGGVSQVNASTIDLHVGMGEGGGSYATSGVPFAFDGAGGQDLGEDVSTYPDLDSNFLLQSGNRVVAEAILRMLETPRGGLVYAPDRGYDVRALFGEAITQRTLAQAKRSIEAECLKDERVESIASALDFDAPTSTLTVRLEVTTAAGPFRLTLAVTAVSLTILDGGT